MIYLTCAGLSVCLNHDKRCSVTGHADVSSNSRKWLWTVRGRQSPAGGRQAATGTYSGHFPKTHRWLVPLRRSVAVRLQQVLQRNFAQNLVDVAPVNRSEERR